MNTQSDSWMKTKKVLALVTAVLLWIISIIFSYNGFSLDSGKGMAWVGVIMAFAITVLELIFNANTAETVVNKRAEFGAWFLVLGGILAYVFDVWTNVLGFYAARGMGIPSFETLGLDFIVPFLVGTFMAILPEPLFVWGLRMDTKSKTKQTYVPSVQPQHQRPNSHGQSGGYDRGQQQSYNTSKPATPARTINSFFDPKK